MSPAPAGAAVACAVAREVRVEGRGDVVAVDVSASQRAKGAAFEREIVQVLLYHWPDARRTSDGREQRARGDIAHGPPGVHIECKRQERLNVAAALRQAIADADEHDIPVVVHRPSRCETMATLPLSDLLVLLQLRER